MYLPIGIFGLSVATAAIPALSRDAARGDEYAVRATFSSALRMMLVLNVPATVGLMVLASPIVALLFEHGSFTAAAASGTAAALICYSPGLIGYSAVKLAAPTFYALRDSRTPVVVGAVSVAVNAVLSLALVRVLGVRGLALGTALASIFNATALLWLLRRRLGSIDGRRVALAVGKVGIAALAMAAAAWAGERGMESLLPGHSTLAKLAHVAAGVGLGLAVLAASARALRIAEFDSAVAAVRARFFTPKTV
jgi:putative peptidoglycan lipid II flippase